jgi:hypothetical protein
MTDWRRSTSRGQGRITPSLSESFSLAPSPTGGGASLCWGLDLRPFRSVVRWLRWLPRYALLIYPYLFPPLSIHPYAYT